MKMRINVPVNVDLNEMTEGKRVNRMMVKEEKGGRHNRLKLKIEKRS